MLIQTDRNHRLCDGLRTAAPTRTYGKPDRGSREIGVAVARASLLLLPLIGATTGVAQDLEPRSYSNLPIGQNYLGIVYGYSEGEIDVAPSVPIKDADLTAKTYAGAYVRSIDFGGKPGKIDLQWARVCIKGEAIFRGEKAGGDRCGTTDPQVRITYLFHGARSMDMREFLATETGRVIGVSLAVSPPLGDYNNENLINTGAHRWTFRPEIGISNRHGNWSLEGAFGARLFTENDRYFGHTKLEQDPIYQLQAHLIYHLPRGRWLSLNGNYFRGGKTTKDGVEGDDLQENSRVGVTLGWPLNNQHSLKLYANRGVVTRIGNDFDTYGAVWQYRWGD